MIREWLRKRLGDLQDDPIERARRRYEASPFKTTLRTWDELTPKEREPWVELVERPA